VHWPATPAVQVLAPVNTAAYSEASVPQLLRPPSTVEPPAPVVPPAPPRPSFPLVPPAPLVPPVPGTYEQNPALPPSVATHVVLSAIGQARSQTGPCPAQPAATQASSIVESTELSVT
jgi:hypothetical protein